MSLRSFLTGAISPRTPAEIPILDTTLYWIKTKTKTYEGFIIHQSDVMIKFLSIDDKSLTILKSNIDQVKIILKAGATPVHHPKMLLAIKAKYY
jgi:hypothetical protein